MTCRFFRVTITGTDESKLNDIKNWVDSKIENNDLVETLNYSSGVYEENFDSGIFTFSCDLYIKMSVNLNKYKDIIVDRFKLLNKDGLTGTKIMQYDNCSHDNEMHYPCEPDVRMEWP